MGPVTRVLVALPDYVIMKNRRAMGSIPGHRVRVKDKKDAAKPAMPLVQELGTRYLEPAKPAAAAAAAATSSTCLVMTLVCEPLSRFGL